MDATGYSFERCPDCIEPHIFHVDWPRNRVCVLIIPVTIGLNVVLSTTMDDDIPRPICCPTKLISPAQIPGAIGVTPETKHDQMLAVRSTLWYMQSRDVKAPSMKTNASYQV